MSVSGTEEVTSKCLLSEKTLRLEKGREGEWEETELPILRRENWKEPLIPGVWISSIPVQRVPCESAS